MDRTSYISPLSDRYGSRHMRYIFSQENKFTVWRDLWIALAKAEMDLGVDAITQDMIDEMKEFRYNVNYDDAEVIESRTHHDVMAHILAYGKQCPSAKGIIHLGATSCYVSDNADIIIMRNGLRYIRSILNRVIQELCEFADKYADTVTLAYTHLQPAQYTTIGKRATLWMNELVMDLEDINHVLGSMKLLGCKGATGTQASILELFDGDMTKVDMLDKMVADEMGFDGGCVDVSGQTYSRKMDTRISNVLAGISASASKFANDIRLLASMGEVTEPFGSNQVGSSAMAYKRNPIKCENMSSLARYVIVNSQNQQLTSSVQWLERSLDDSANRRLSIPELFLTVDHILHTYIDVISGIAINHDTINKRVMDELPFIATENMMMDLVSGNGMDRQEVHEIIRQASMETRQHMANGGSNDLVSKLANKGVKLDIGKPSDYTGCAEQQTMRYVNKVEATIRR